MLPPDLSIGRLMTKSFTQFPSFRFRDKDVTVHNAGDATKCGRALTYKALKTPESNPTDSLGHFRMKFGSWLEKGLIYDLIPKLAPFGVYQLANQGDCGEHGTFYGTSWHGYRDLDLAVRLVEQDGSVRYKPFVTEVKTKVGYGAVATIKAKPWSKEFVVPEPDHEWGYSQQLSLYLRDAYQKTKDNPQFKSPIVDGMLLQLLFGDGIGCFVEYFFKYKPDIDATHCYRVHCDQYPECSAPLDLTFPLKEIADRWSKIDPYLLKGELAPPDYQRKYTISDDRVQEATKTDLQKAAKNQVIIGDTHCKYCNFRDKCSTDLGIPLTYSPEEVKEINRILKDR